MKSDNTSLTSRAPGLLHKKGTSSFVVAQAGVKGLPILGSKKVKTPEEPR
jgi:hypothetical protein